MLQTSILAFSLSADAFAVSVAKGARFPGLSLGRAAGIALSFGLFEATAPLLGFALSQPFAAELAAVDHWIAFAILAGLGARMVWKSIHPGDTARPAAASPRWPMVLAAGLGASIDAAAIGMTLALFGLEILITALTIGAVTFLMAFLGLRLGRFCGSRGGRYAEALGGFGLTLIGAHILATHLA